LESVAGIVSVDSPRPNAFDVETEGDLRPALAEAVVRAGGKLWDIDAETQSLDAIYAHYFEEDIHEYA